MIRRKDGQYLSDRRHHRFWAKALARAQTFLTKEGAAKAVEHYGGEAVLVEMKEIHDNPTG